MRGPSPGAGAHEETLNCSWQMAGSRVLTTSPTTAGPCIHCQIHLQKRDWVSTADFQQREGKGTLKRAGSETARSQEQPGDQTSRLRPCSQSLADRGGETASPSRSQPQPSSPAHGARPAETARKFMSSGAETLKDGACWWDRHAVLAHRISKDLLTAAPFPGASRLPRKNYQA